MSPSFKQTFLLAIGLAMIFEGFLYVVLARRWQTIVTQLLTLPGQRIRQFGIILVVVGLLWLLVVHQLT